MANNNSLGGIFDIAGPGSNSASSSMAAVGSPAGDPSIRGIGFDSPAPEPGAVPITVNRVSPAPAMPAASRMAPAIAESGDNDLAAALATDPTPNPLFSSDDGKFNPNSGAPSGGSNDPIIPQPAGSPKKGGGKWLWWLLGLIVVLAAAYLLIDARVIKTSIKLPYHFFSQPASTNNTSSNTTSSTSVPTGFTQYQLNDASLEFDAPAAWGTPSFSLDPGYSQRGGSNKSDGTHAYLVNFAQNKDVQLAFTSGKLLPASRTDNRYFDDLQWCMGSIDQKFYMQKLAYTTTSGVDTPATVVCGDGPQASATQVNSSTILVPKLKAANGTTIGNVYTKNLSGNQTVVVARALDITGANDTNIQTLLGTIQNL